MSELSTNLRVIALSKGLRKIRWFENFFPNVDLCYRPPARLRRSDCIVLWGGRPSATKARAFALKWNLATLNIEDGFMRSVGLGHEDSTLSLIVDDLSPYFCASSPSRLEEHVRTTLSDDESTRARALMDGWTLGRISKYNHLRDTDYSSLVSKAYVLVVDQTFGDASVAAGNATAETFQEMLTAAISENPALAIVVKVHPDVICGKKKGYFCTEALSQSDRIIVVSEPVHPVSLIEHAEKVYVVTSQVGFEALIWKRPVRTFGMPFYAGWGLTHDEQQAPVRRRSVSLEQLVYAALIRASRYVDPESGEPCEAERVLEWLALQRRMRLRFPPRLVAIGFSRWKKKFLEAFFDGSSLIFVDKPMNVKTPDPLVVWGSKWDREIRESASLSERLIIRLEDGFLRSRGLGAEFVTPLSCVQDDVGIYYDAGRPSKLENLLNSQVFDVDMMTRAANLRKSITASRVSKYNVGTTSAIPKRNPSSLLVIGQVETDASIRFGGYEIKRNVDLLRRVRADNPQAHILYKPHPDVVARLRTSDAEAHEISSLCNAYVGEVALPVVLDAVDEVHTITSLAGFEALLRGKEVHTYGVPFYAGWGLTSDRALPMSVSLRRERRLSIDELVAGALLIYPTYVSSATARFTSAERILFELNNAQPASWFRRNSRKWLARILSKP